MRQLMCFFGIKACKTILVVTQNEFMKMNMSQSVRLDAFIKESILTRLFFTKLFFPNISSKVVFIFFYHFTTKNIKRHEIFSSLAPCEAVF